MKKSILIFIVFSFFFSLLAESHPVDVSLFKKNKGYVLRVSVPKDFGIQREAPNRILLSGNGVQILKANTRFSGPINPSKKDYFKKVNDMPVSLKGKGTLQISGKVFYCDYVKNICQFAKIQKEETIP
ncbi:MAG: hypothetical protein H7A25_13370 [Leptospiraceae bacterium]|nr:hypothetical protein [Leptospiraceae bacterium]